MNYKKALKFKGITLVETVMTISIVSITMIGFTMLFVKLWKIHGFAIETGMATSLAVRTVDNVEKYVSKSRNSENGSYPIVSASENEFVFYSDYDQDGIVERIRYFLDAQELKVGIVEPDVTQIPASYNDDTETIKTVTYHVVNGVISNPGNDCTEYQLIESITGRPNNRFTSLGMARNVKHSGIYYFNINGNVFDTQVDSDGWVLVAAGSRGTHEGSYSQVYSLDYDSDSILKKSIITNLNDIKEVRIQATNQVWLLEDYLPHDLKTDNDVIVNNLKSFRTLASSDSENASWECLGYSGVKCNDSKARMELNSGSDPDKPAGCTADDLDKHLYFACNNSTGMIWTHFDGPTDWDKEQIVRGNRENDINLYVRSSPDSNKVYLTAKKGESPCAADEFKGDDGYCYTESNLVNSGAVCTNTSAGTGTRPLFRYFGDFEQIFDSGDNFDYDKILNSELSYPIDISKIRLVKILLNINIDPKQNIENVQISSFVDIKNLVSRESVSPL